MIPSLNIPTCVNFRKFLPKKSWNYGYLVETLSTSDGLKLNENDSMLY